TERWWLCSLVAPCQRPARAQRNPCLFMRWVLNPTRKNTPSVFPRFFCVPFASHYVTTARAMFSLQRLLGKEDMFFELLEASAEEARNSVQSLVKLCMAVRASTDVDRAAQLEEFARARRKDKEITGKIREAVYTTFVTAL